MNNDQKKNEYIVEYFDFPPREQAVMVGQLFQEVETRKKFTTPLVFILFSLFEQLGVESASNDGKGGVSLGFAKSEYYKKLQGQLGDKFIARAAYDLVSILRYLNIKSFKRNIDSFVVKKMFIKTDKALLAHLTNSLKK